MTLSSAGQVRRRDVVVGLRATAGSDVGEAMECDTPSRKRPLTDELAIPVLEVGDDELSGARVRGDAEQGVADRGLDTGDDVGRGIDLHDVEVRQ